MGLDDFVREMQVALPDMNIEDEVVYDGVYAVILKGKLDGELVAVKVVNPPHLIVLAAGETVEEKAIRVRANFETSCRIHEELYSTLDDAVVPVSRANYDGHPFLVMPWMGKDLAAFTDSTVSLRDRIKYTIQMVEILAGLHQQGVVYGDMKAENFLLHPDDESKISVADFDMSSWSSRGLNHTHKKHLIEATLEFLCLDLLNSKVHDMASDRYAAGVAVYYLLTDEHHLGFTDDMEDLDMIHCIVLSKCSCRPMTARNFKDYTTPRLIAKLNEICERATRVNPAERYQDLGVMAADLRGALEICPDLSQMPQ